MKTTRVDDSTYTLAPADPPLNVHATDRAAGVLLGAACGDALGVPYEFARRLNPDEQPAMIGGGLGPYKPGEYSDDTQMHVCIAAVASTGSDLTSPTALDQIARNFHFWRDGGASDIGGQTSNVLSAAKNLTGTPAQAMSAAADAYTARTRYSAGNGSLMRTGVVALAYLDDVEGMVRAATLISSLTHSDPECIEACILWCAGIRTAVLEGTFNGVRDGLALLPETRREIWRARLDEAEENPPHHWPSNGYVVTALQAAWSAITRTPVPELAPERGSFPAQHLQLATEAAVRAGCDTDTVAAIAGALLGARWGVSAIPLAWQQAVNGWPAPTAASDLVRLAVLTARKGLDDNDGWPSAPRVEVPGYAGKAYVVQHPDDPGVLLGNLPVTEFAGTPPVDAVVSLCRVGQARIFSRTNVEHVRVWLVDKEGENPNLHYALDQAARQVLRLRKEGKRVFLHCVAGRSRTPAVAATYSTLLGTDPRTALTDVWAALGKHWTLLVHQQLHDAVYELAGQPPYRPSSPIKKFASLWRRA
ncbi:ADP-ribosylglycohydrolase family protein [Streptomyces sp. NPDC059611]|uniref:ADP-ribosylglycohydrolase family protein n=1 Tax=Streptomyces sp. NPDC059611 TaxID=3346884 RepID=UPI0036C5F98C